MDDGFDLVVIEGENELIALHQVAFYEDCFFSNRGAMAFAQIIIGDCAMTLRDQLFNDDAADILGAACDKYIHCLVICTW